MIKAKVIFDTSSMNYRVFFMDEDKRENHYIDYASTSDPNYPCWSWVTLDPTCVMTPAFTLGEDFMRALAEAAIDAGLVKPPEHSSEVIDAKNEHINDLRKIVFNEKGVEF